MLGFKKRIYLDYASATPVHPQALDAVFRASTLFGNPGGIHAESVEAKASLQQSRERVAAHIGCKAREIVFISGLTEGNALAILGVARALEHTRRTLKGTHWLTSSIEHSSVLECFAEVERLGGDVEYIEPDSSGLTTAEHVEKKLRPETVFVSIGWGNNEIGTIQPLGAIARALRAHEKKHKSVVLFQSDGGQAPLYISPQAHTLGVDLLSLGSGKLYGPRGTGCLYVSARTNLSSVSFGGRQERALRAGTEDVALAAGFAEVLDIVAGERSEESKRLEKLRDELARGIETHISGALVNGSLKHSLPHMLNISIPGSKSGEYLALRLDRLGVSLSTKSACREGEAVSHVVQALGGPDWRAKNTLRFSLGTMTTSKEIKRTIEIVQRLISHSE
jgi:cysteine desulfurase